MDLWIRSQSKGVLVKINDLRIMQLDKDDFRALIEEDARDGWSIIANDDPCIGTYKTKERALEVLEEIQNAILGILTLEDIEEQKIKKYTGDATLSKVTNCLIYRMPKE